MTLVTLYALAEAAHACGALFVPPGEIAISNTQEAILQAASDDTVRVAYRILAERDASDFGWVIPIPGPFVDLADGDEDDFTRLRAATAPEEDLADDGGLACGPVAKDGRNEGLRQGGVDVVAEGFTGTYAFAALDASSTDALLDWLADHDYAVGTAGPLLDAYVADGGWQFVAIRLEATAAPEYGAEALPPVEVAWEGRELVYPARITASSTDPTQHTILYVRGDESASIVGDGWSSVDVPEVWDAGEDPAYMRYEAWPERLRELGEANRFGRVFSGRVDGDWVTRLETLAPTENYEVGDITLAFDGDAVAQRTVISNRRGCAAPEGAALLVLPLGAILLSRRED